MKPGESNQPAPDLPELCHSLMERSPVPMAEMEGAGHILRYVNPAFCRLVGKNKEALVGKPFAKSAQEADTYLALLDRVYRTGEAETHTEPEHPEPHPASWSYAVWPVLDADERPVGVMMQVTETTQFHQQTSAMNEALLLSSIRQHELTERAEKLNAQLQAEITERKRAEEDREQLLMREQAARAEAETANRMKDNFLATVSHELRTPLNAIFGWIQLLSNRTLDEETFTHAVETIARNTRSQAKIIDDLLDISRIITGKLQLEIQSVDLIPVIEAAIDAVSLAADAKSIRFQTRLDPQAGPVSGDPNRLQQIIWNLLFNAIKFTPKQGRVEVGLEQAESQVVITVADTGQGIGEELMPYIFDRFHQADSTSARKHGGLGLGLSIVRQLVEMHGGSVHADSPGEGQGATLTVTLPLKAPRVEEGYLYSINPADLGEMFLGSAPALDGLRVLVVDDEADARDIFSLMLTQCGAEVRMSASAAEALESLEQWRPDVLVSDIGMAGEDGYELMRKVRALEPERGGQTPAVALTGYANVEDQKRALAAGYQMHLPKPVALIELAAAVAVLAGRAGTD